MIVWKLQIFKVHDTIYGTVILAAAQDLTVYAAMQSCVHVYMHAYATHSEYEIRRAMSFPTLYRHMAEDKPTWPWKNSPFA